MNWDQYTKEMGDYEVIDKIDVMNVIDSTWSFKLKVFPDGLI